MGRIGVRGRESMLTRRVFQRTADELHLILGADLIVADLEGRVLASAGKVPTKAISNIIHTFLLSDKEQDTEQGVCLMRFCDYEEPVCIVAAYGSRRAPEALAWFGSLCRILFYWTRSVDRESFFQRLITDTIAPSDLLGCACELDLDPEKPRIVYALPVPDNHGIVLADRICSELRLGLDDDDVLIIGRTVPVVIHECQPDPVREKDSICKLEKILTACTSRIDGMHIGQSSIADHLNQLNDAYHEALDAVEAGRVFRRGELIYRCSELLFELMITHLPMSACRELVRITGMQSFFECADSGTIKAVLVFLDNKMNAAETSRQLYFHPNSLRYRFDKIESQSGLDVTDFNDASIFRISWMLNQYIREEDINSTQDRF